MFFFVFMGVGIVERQRRRALATEAGGFDVSPGLAVVTEEPAAKGVVEDHDFVFPYEDHDFVYPDGTGPAKRA